MRHFVISVCALLANMAFAQSVINPGAVNHVAGPGSASVVAPGQLKKDFDISPKYTAPGQVKKGYQEQGKGNQGKGNLGKGNGK